MVNFKERHSIEEWIDRPEADTGELFRALDEQHIFNEWFGGYDVSLKGIQTLLPDHVESCRIMDVGCGGGELSKTLHRMAKRKKINLYYIGIDLNPKIIQYARQKNPPNDQTEFCCESIFEIEKQNRVDIVHASLCMHHFQHYHAVEALRRMYDLCVYGVVINDLHRHPLAYYSIQCLTALGSQSEMIRHDSPASVLNAFSLHDLYDLAGKAGVPTPVIRWHWAFRWLMLIPKKSQVKLTVPMLQPEWVATKTS